MKTKLFFPACCGLALLTADAAGTPIETSPVSLTVKYADIPHIKELPGAGVIVSLRSHIEGETLFSGRSTRDMTDQDCDLTLKDSTGANLGKMKIHTRGMGDESRKNAFYSVKIDRLPTQGAEWLKVEGKVSIATLSDQTVSKATDLVIENGKTAKATINGIQFEFTRNDSGNLSVKATLQSGAAPFELVFSNEEGGKIDAQIIGSMEMSDPFGKTVTRSYRIGDLPERIKVSVATWKEAKTAIPVDVTIPLAPDKQHSSPTNP